MAQYERLGFKTELDCFGTKVNHPTSAPSIN